jgi:hypothetical protein
MSGLMKKWKLLVAIAPFIVLRKASTQAIVVPASSGGVGVGDNHIP